MLGQGHFLASLFIIVSLFTFSFFLTDTYGSHTGTTPPLGVCAEYDIPALTLDPIPAEAYGGTTITFSGKVTCDGIPMTNTLIIIREVNPVVDFSYNVAEGRTNSNGEFSIDWIARADEFEKELDFVAAYWREGWGDYAFSNEYQIHVFKMLSEITLDPIPKSAEIGDVLIFSGKLKLQSGSPEGFVIYIKD